MTEPLPPAHPGGEVALVLATLFTLAFLLWVYDLMAPTYGWPVL